MAHQLQAVADSKDRHPDLEDPLVGDRRIRGEHRARAARENDPNYAVRPQLLRGSREVVNLGEYLALSDPARDDLRVLRPEIEYGDGLRHVRDGKRERRMRPARRPQERLLSFFGTGREFSGFSAANGPAPGNPRCFAPTRRTGPPVRPSPGRPRGPRARRRRGPPGGRTG